MTLRPMSTQTLDDAVAVTGWHEYFWVFQGRGILRSPLPAQIHQPAPSVDPTGLLATLMHSTYKPKELKQPQVHPQQAFGNSSPPTNNCSYFLNHLNRPKLSQGNQQHRPRTLPVKPPVTRVASYIYVRSRKDFLTASYVRFRISCASSTRCSHLKNEFYAKYNKGLREVIECYERTILKKDQEILDLSVKLNFWKMDYKLNSWKMD
ncbi:hypothetical protein FIE12Z_11038 [Fusarium flagelliforme]|uniref:Uncharacterized protein n=1 Tax=Fusarium flagelliforme TaxID=2675880 RepID=A0A395MBP8_9HYPO|nr:hypothetical protein FIE12Z_11038 [Fusarium flagelliforme]